MKQRIAILGGGISSLTTAFELTEQPGWQDRYEITVYQTGWRLGGKGASGINPGAQGRIEEHGLHVWFGFYHNAFGVMRRCYEALGRPPSAPLATLEQAFTPMSSSTFMEKDGEPWTFTFPQSDEWPGGARRLPSVGDSIARLAWWVDQTLRHDDRLAGLRAATLVAGAPVVRLTEGLGDRLPLSEAIHSLIAKRGAQLIAGSPRLKQSILQALEQLRGALSDWFEPRLEERPLRRAWTLLELALAGLRGMIADNVATRGYRSIDHLEFRTWMARHGASERALDSGVVRTLYDIFFAFEGGDLSRPSVAAGATIRGLFQLFGYRGAVLYKMNAGMGDAVFGPLYEVLRARGVRFRFFHRVKRLRLSKDKRAIETVEVARQARLRLSEYEPLIDAHGLPCWPSEPRWTQLEGSDALRGADLEKEDGPDAQPLTLRRGADFDRVVLGIPLPALPPIAGELIEHDPKWQAMVQHVGSVRTQALQLWFRRPLRDQGCTFPSGMIASYEQPFSSWSDFSGIIERENWHPSLQPSYLGYSCGVLSDEVPVEAARGVVRDNAERWLDAHSAALWPTARTQEGFEYGALVDPGQRKGPARLEGQYYRANVAPEDRYVLALPGTTQHRLKPEASGFDNLVLCGDWTDNRYTLACIEAAVMSGRFACRALCGAPTKIPGEETP